MNEIIERIKTMPGHTGFYCKNMITGETAAYHENDCFVPASVIKLPMLMEIYRLAHLGETDLNETILIRDEDKMPSCGALNAFDGDIRVTIGTLCTLMITISDNTATNVLISHFGTEKLNAGFQEMGLKDTRVNRLLFDSQAAKKGIQNVITPAEIGMILEKLYRNEFVNRQVSEAVKDVLFRQQIEHKIKEKLPPETIVGNKPGDDDDISHDAGIVYAKQPFVVCFMSNKTIPGIFNPFIRETSLALFTKYNK